MVTKKVEVGADHADALYAAFTTIINGITRPSSAESVLGSRMTTGLLIVKARSLHDEEDT